MYVSVRMRKKNEVSKVKSYANNDDNSEEEGKAVGLPSRCCDSRFQKLVTCSISLLRLTAPTPGQ